LVVVAVSFTVACDSATTTTTFVVFFPEEGANTKKRIGRDSELEMHQASQSVSLSD
jgi:hypothetical protein